MSGRPQDPAAPNLIDRLGDFWHNLDGVLQGLVLLGAAGAVVLAVARFVLPRVRDFFADLRSIRDTLVGRPAMRDSITNRPIPNTARPGIGERMDDMAESVKKLADTSTRLDEHDKRISRIEDALQIDRRLDKIESIQLLRTIETSVQADPSETPPEGERPD